MNKQGCDLTACVWVFERFETKNILVVKTAHLGSKMKKNC